MWLNQHTSGRIKNRDLTKLFLDQLLELITAARTQSLPCSPGSSLGSTPATLISFPTMPGTCTQSVHIHHRAALIILWANLSLRLLSYAAAPEYQLMMSKTRWPKKDWSAGIAREFLTFVTLAGAKTFVSWLLTQREKIILLAAAAPPRNSSSNRSVSK